MAIGTMGVRAALRTAQDANGVAAGPVVAAIATAGAPTQLAGEPANSPGAMTQWLQRLSAWIPSESVAAFLVLSSSFSVFDDTTSELVVVVVLTLLTGLYAAKATVDAHDRRELASTKFRKAILTALIAMIAFLVWWIATPGTAPTADWHVKPLYAALTLFVAVAAIPYLAQSLKLDPALSVRTNVPAAQS